MSETAAHAPPFRTNPSAHDRHRVASHETRVERVAARVALLVPQIVPGVARNAPVHAVDLPGTPRRLVLPLALPRHRHEVLVVARHARRAVRARRALFHARKARPVGAVVPLVADRAPARRGVDAARRAKHRARPARVVAQEHPRRGVARRAECRVPRAREAGCVARCVSGRCAPDAGRRLHRPHMTRRRTSGRPHAPGHCTPPPRRTPRAPRRGPSQPHTGHTPRSCTRRSRPP